MAKTAIELALAHAEALEAQRDALAARLAEAERDAARYRWLRHAESFASVRWARWEVRHWTGQCWDSLLGDALDADIDAARAADSASPPRDHCPICGGTDVSPLSFDVMECSKCGDYVRDRTTETVSARSTSGDVHGS
jgi:hypothetical protein